jgi:predicted ribosome quality control (RQC) complex YloA/Tae2 family protein
VNATVVDGLRKLMPARLQKVSVSKDRILLEVYLQGGKRWVSIDQSGGCVAVVDAKPARDDDEAAPPAVQGLFRKELQPGALTAADEASLTFTRADGKERVLHLERERVVLCAGDKILAVVGAKASDGRDLRRGKVYERERASSTSDAISTTSAPMSSPAHPDDSPPRSSTDRASVKPAPPRDPLAELRDRLRAEKKRLKRLVDALGRDLAKHGDPARHENDGELLKTALHRVQRGDTDVVVDDWTGVARTLLLDPALDAKDNLSRIFKRAKKARLARDHIGPRLDDTRRALAGVDATIASLSVDTADSARALLSRPEAGGSARRKAAKAGKREPWRSFACHGNVVVRVGRGAKDNDALVKSARGNDLWLHARDQAGAHVVIPMKSAADNVDADLLVDAAHLAAHFSAARNEARVDVQHTRVKNLRKAAAPGLVIVTNEAVLHLRVDAERTRRLLAAEVPS